MSGIERLEKLVKSDLYAAYSRSNIKKGPYSPERILKEYEKARTRRPTSTYEGYKYTPFMSSDMARWEAEAGRTFQLIARNAGDKLTGRADAALAYEICETC